jgi:2-keto-4-pentenoate hydratase
VLGAFGETLRAGDAVITGMVTPPVPMAPGSYEMRSAELGSITVAVV